MDFTRDPKVEQAALKLFPREVVKAKTIKELKRELQKYDTLQSRHVDNRERPAHIQKELPFRAPPSKPALVKSGKPKSILGKILEQLLQFFDKSENEIVTLVKHLSSVHNRLAQMVNNEHLFTPVEHDMLTHGLYEQLRVQLHEFYTKRNSMLTTLNKEHLLDNGARAFFEKQQAFLYDILSQLDQYSFNTS